MFNTSNSFTDNIKRYSWLLVLPLIVGLFLSSCGDSPIDAQTDFTDSSSTSVNNNIEFVPDQFDAVGTIQGTVIDKATGEALSDVAVSLNFMPEEAEEPSVITDTTGSEGTFAFTGVPVNTDAENYLNSGESNSPYTLKITTEELDNYRDLYRYNAPLSFESTGGDGAATNLVSDITIPLSEQAVTLKGKAHTFADATLSDVKVELYQQFNPIINGGSDTQTDMLVDSAETGDDGSFEFNGVEEKANVWLRFVEDSDPSDVINHEYTNINETPAADGTTPEMDLGVINVSSSDQSGAFYITSITPEPGSDVGIDTSFTFTFNRSVAENPWTDASQGFGAGTFKDAMYFHDNGQKKSPGNIEFDVSWNDDRTELTITPDNLVDANKYFLVTQPAFDNDVNGDDWGNPLDNGPIAFEDGNFVDEYGNDLSYNASDYDKFEVETLEFSTGDNMEAPHTPELALEYNDDVDFDDGNPSGNATVTWDVDESEVPVKQYEVYISQNGGPYEHHQTFNENTDHDENEMSSNYFATSNFTSGSNLEIYNNEEGAVSTDIKIRAISNNFQHGEFSESVTFEDIVDPEVFSWQQGTEANGNEDELLIAFTEPLNKNTAEDTSNYTIDDDNNDITISSIEYDFEGISRNSGDWDLVITVENADNLSNGTVEVSEDVTDLNGNGMDSDNNTAQY